MKIKTGILVTLSLLILLALAGTGSAKMLYGGTCANCHTNNIPALIESGTLFNDTHKFDGSLIPSTGNSCSTCHLSVSTSDFSLTVDGASYNTTHRYNATTLASVTLIGTDSCYNCHVDVVANDFSRNDGAPTFLTSATCENCHKAKYDTWSNTTHAVMLTPNDTAETMGLPEPEVGWENISYVLVTKFEFAYINATGFFLSVNDTYNTEEKDWENSTHKGGRYGTCVRCHTTGYDASGVNELVGIDGTFEEPGIGCERCHGAAGNGHQVTVDYSATLCNDCHSGGRHGTGWEKGGHAPPVARGGSNCAHCHSPFDKYQTNGLTSNTDPDNPNVACGVCHNSHDITDDKYADTFSNGGFNSNIWADIADSKLSFFNGTASLAAGMSIFDDLTNVLLYPGTDSSRKDSSYGTEPINLTDRPASDVLCSSCHYRHGLAHMAGVNASHGQYYYDKAAGAACIDCHMAGASATVGKDMMANHGGIEPLAVDTTSCGGATRCHTTSAQNLSESEHSVIPIMTEWNASAHNVKYVGVGGDYNHWYGRVNETTGGSDIPREPLCNRCHDPQNWNPDDDADTTKVALSKDFKGVACTTCHNLHDMGNWLAMTKEEYGEAKSYAWYDVDAVKTSHGYKAGYQMVENTTVLCGNCHTTESGRANRDEPGWKDDAATRPNYVHGFPAKDMFVGSMKYDDGFECIDCHMSSMLNNSTSVLPDSEKVKGHSFEVNATLLQNKTACAIGCHSGSNSISAAIEKTQTRIKDKWNTTNQSVEEALAEINALSGDQTINRTMIAQAYWNKEFVSREESWGVHNSAMADALLDEATSLAVDRRYAIISDGSALPGATTTVTITANNMSNLSNFNITVEYNYTVVSVTGATNNAEFGDTNNNRFDNATDGFVYIATNTSDSTAAENGSIVLSTLNLISRGTAGQTSPLNITITDLTNNSAGDILYVMEFNGTYTVGTPTPPVEEYYSSGGSNRRLLAPVVTTDDEVVSETPVEIPETTTVPTTGKDSTGTVPSKPAEEEPAVPEEDNGIPGFGVFTALGMLTIGYLVRRR